MAKVKIMKKELVWDIFCSADGSKIGTTKSIYRFEEKLLEKMYSIVSIYYDYTYIKFIDRFYFFVAPVGTYDYCIYRSLEELKNEWAEQDVYFYMVSHNKWSMIEVEADYFSIQDTDSYDKFFTKAIYQDYDSAIKYCRENNVDINNIVPQEWGEYTFLFD